MRDRGGSIKKLGMTGREVPSDEKLPEELQTMPQVEIQPGGVMFAKARLSYPNDKDDDEGAKRPAQIRGMPVSGRQWKLECKRSSSMRVANKLIRKSWDEKLKDRARDKQIKAKQNALVQARIEEKREKKRLAEERQKRKEENRLKGAVVQSISTMKVKKMSRKQLRMIRKMDTSNEGKVFDPKPIEKTKGLKGKVKI
eukprot:755160-Hanusia_phi.AAC.1